MSAFPTSAATSVAALINLRREFINRPDKILDLTQSQSYLLAKLLSSGFKQTIPYGDTLTDQLFLDNAGNFAPYVPGSDRTTSDPPAPTRAAIAPTYYENSWSWTDDDKRISGAGTADQRLSAFKNYMDWGLGNLRGAHIKGLENLLTAAPNANMEQLGVQGAPMMSIPTILSEEASGAVNGFTTVLQINPSTKSAWRPQRETYDWNNPLSVDVGLPNAFHRMFLATKWQPVQGGDAANFQASSETKKFIATNKDGHATYAKVLGSMNQFTRQGPQDFNYQGPNYFGIPLLYVTAYDTALLDSQAGTAYSQAWPTGKPRYQWIDTEYLYLMCAPDGFMTVSPAEKFGGSRPDAQVVYERTKGNLFCHARNRLGVIVPAT
mgnify:CR=1 FL=1